MSDKILTYQTELKVNRALPRSFFERDTAEVAQSLLGAFLVRGCPEGIMATRIVEVEAYFGAGDPASHAARGVTPRNKIMYGVPGFAYVYLNYGIHNLLNVVTEAEGTPGAVLIRGVEPVAGVELMKRARPVGRVEDMTNGPGKLTQAMRVTLADNGVDLTRRDSGLFIAEGRQPQGIRRTKRIGVTSDLERPFRFHETDCAFVSCSKPR